MNMKKLLSGLIVILFSATAANASGFYISGGIGMNYNSGDVKNVVNGAGTNVKESYKAAPIYGLGLGYDLPVLPFRGEIEYVRATNDINRTLASLLNPNFSPKDITLEAVTANIYARVPIFGVYAGIGGGQGRLRGKTIPVYQGMVGIEFGVPVLPMHIGFEYRRVQAGQDAKTLNSKYEFKSNSVMLRARIGF